MATVPKVLFMEQKYTCIFLLKFRHQGLLRDLCYTKPATPADVTRAGVSIPGEVTDTADGSFEP